MTEARGRAARWSAAALAAPVAAGLFAGTTAWAAGHDPLHPNGTAGVPAPAAAPSSTQDAALLALRQQVAANAATVARLSRQVAAVKAQAAAMAGKGKAGGGSSSYTRSGSSRSSGHSSSTGATRSSGGSHTVTAPAPKPPPTQTTTGASGAPK